MIVTGQWLTLGLGLLSLALGLGWRRLEQNQTDNRIWQLIAVPGFKGAAIFFYYVGIPYLALILGILTPRMLGLKGLEYFALVDWNSHSLTVETQQATTLMLVEWLLDSSAAILAGSAALLILIAIHISLIRNEVELKLLGESKLYTIYYGLHWAFYRAIFWSVTDDLYLGVVFGLGFVMVEWILTSWLQRQWSEQRQQFLINSIILILTSTIFFYSPNLWLLWPIHLMLVAVTNRRWGVMTMAQMPDR